jgi:hypothetical protein
MNRLQRRHLKALGLDLDAGQIDDTDPRIKKIACLLCQRLLFVERGSQCDKEGMCQSCSMKSDLIAASLPLQ